MGADDVPGAGTSQTGDAARGGSVVQAAGDIHGGIHIGHDPGERVLGRLNPYTDARRLAEMDHDAAADLLAGSPVPKAARVIAALLSADSADYALAVSLLGSIDRDIAEELLAAAGTAAAGLEHLPEAAEAIADCAAERNRRGQEKSLGRTTTLFMRAAPSEQTREGYYQNYQRGTVHWTARGGAQAISGAAHQYYFKMGGSSRGGRLGFPLGPEKGAAQSRPFGTDGTWQRFEGPADFSDEVCQRLGMRCGATLYCSEHGAHATWGPIGEFYDTEEGPAGWLGFPVSDETEAGPSRRDKGKGTTGLCQRFEGGTVYFSDKTKTIAVPASIAEHHEKRHRGVASALGFPVSPMLEAAPSLEPYNTSGHFQRFEGRWDYRRDILEHWSDAEGPGGATIYTCDRHGTHCVGWGNGTLYELLGGTGSWLGFPKSDEIRQRPSSADQPGHTVQEFEGGVVIYSPEHGSVSVPAATMEYLDQHAGLRERLGLPLRRPLTSAADELVQFFEHGVVTTRDGTPEAYLRAVPPSETGEDPQRISLVALNFRPETVACGEPIFLEYEIEALSGASSPIMLGASLLAENGDEYFDEASDLQIDLSPGRARYRRPLVVPASAPAGRYRLIGAVWHHVIGEQRLARIDHGFVVTVTAGITE